MPDYSSLPDPFIAELDRIPGFRELTQGFTLCAECERCERSLVYLTPAEQEAARRLGLRVYGQGGGTRLNRVGCKCPFYLGPARGCAAYRERPLICHLFPLDIVQREDDGRYWWVLFGACAEVERGKLRGRIEDARALATEIDRRLPDRLRHAFMADSDGAVFEPVFWENPIYYLTPLTLPGREGGTAAGR